MSDEALRGLERAVASSPDDGPARLALGHGLARAGRRLDALAALDVRRVGDASFAETCALAHGLWRDALARLAPAWTVEQPLPDLMSVEFDRSGELLLLRSGWRQGRGGELVVVDARSGDVEQRQLELLDARPIAGGLVGHASIAGEVRLLRLRRAAGAWARETAAGAGRSVLDADATGDRLLLASAERLARVHAWSELRPLSEPFGPHPSVDWDRDLLVAATGGAALELRGLDGRARASISTPAGPRPAMFRDHVAPGVVAQAGPGLWVAHLERGWTAHLDTSPTPGRFVGPVLAGLDGRSVRLFVDGRPARFELDLERGPAPGWAPPPPSVSTRDPRPTRRRGPIHPLADAWAHERPARGAPKALVETFAGAILADLGRDARPRAWSPDGRALAVTTGERGRPRLQLWRAG